MLFLNKPKNVIKKSQYTKSRVYKALKEKVLVSKLNVHEFL